MPKTIVLIVAAGRGMRAGGELPKQYVKLGGKHVLTRTIEAFADHPLVVPHDETARIQEVHGLVVHLLCQIIEDELYPEER